MRRHDRHPVEVAASGELAIVTVRGSIDEHFAGFGALGEPKIVVLDVRGIERITSFGVRQWLAAMEALPKVPDLYLLGCQTCFVDQLNMVLNFGGTAKVLTVVAPYVCKACNVETGVTIDVLGERATLLRGEAPDVRCERCANPLELDDTPETYFTFVAKYAATRIHPQAAQALAANGAYSTVSRDESPCRVIKIVHGQVTYFQISGVIGGMFKARPFLVGAEGELVIDLAEVTRFDPSGLGEWKRLLKNLTNTVPAVTIADVTYDILGTIRDTLALPGIALASIFVPYRCASCGKRTRESVAFARLMSTKEAEAIVCGTCGGTARSELAGDVLAPLGRVASLVPPASAKLIARRVEILSRTVADANVARAGGGQQTDDLDVVFGKYKVLRRLSGGGMADVFLATQVGIEKPVALKRIQHKLLEERQKAIELFLNEAKIASRLTHPNIVQVLDVGEDRGALYLAMEFVNGRDLRKLMRKLGQQRMQMPLGEACHVVREVARALDHAYWSNDLDDKQMAVVHRDVTPHNIIVGFDGSVKLLDFGVAMSAVTEHETLLIVGKWLYMSPEATAQLPLDHRSDLFSLGVVLYYLCAGVTPFAGPNPSEIVTQIRTGSYQRLNRIAPKTPPRLIALVDRLLALDPRDRPARGQDVVRELTEIMRAERFERGAPDLARLLASVFPDETAARPEGRPSAIQEIVQGSGSDLTMKDHSPTSMTPNVVDGIDHSTSLRIGQPTPPTPLAVVQPPAPPPIEAKTWRRWPFVVIAVVLAIAVFLVVR